MRDLSWYAGQQWQVIVIGGGATGAGIVRDCALRGIRALLLEQRDLAYGTSSRFHGLMHSGARYAVRDPEAARECIEENTILRSIGSHCVEETEGYFVCTASDAHSGYTQQWLEACAVAGIPVTPVSLEEARVQEPALAPDVVAVYKVPDAAIDGFRLVWQNAMSAERHGSCFRTYTEVISLHAHNDVTTGVTVRDAKGITVTIPCFAVVNATGSWADKIIQTAGLSIPIKPDRGTLIAFNHRFVNRIINRLRVPSDGDIFVPHGSITIFGTTSRPASKPDDFTLTSEEVRTLLQLGREIIPHIDSYRVLRAFVGTRPLYGATEGRSASRNFVVIDHAEDGLAGAFTVCGGKLTTYRLMAQQATDRICAYLGVSAPCRTHSEPLVAPVGKHLETRARSVFPAQGLEQTVSRLGDSLEGAIARLEANPWKKSLLCECERVTIAEAEQIASETTTHSLSDIRRRTRMGMGTCQGTFCGLRCVGLLAEAGLPDGMWRESQKEPSAHTGAEWLRTFQQERWSGIRPTLWGGALRETELARGIYGATLNMDGADYV